MTNPEIETMLEELRSFLEPASPGARPLFAGAVVLVAHDGEIVAHEAIGHAIRYADGEGTELESPEPMRPDTIFDMASVSKLFTSIVVMQLVESGLLDIERPVAAYLPEFAANGKAEITAKQLLTHISGLPAWIPLWRDWPDRDARIRATLEVAPQAVPGTDYRYSDLNLIALGVLAERVAGEPLDALVRNGITEPLGMRDTGYRPPESKLSRVAATEFSANPARGMVRGEVHDENAWSLGGVAGHAGIFSTAGDMALLCQAVLDGGAPILRPETLRDMLTDHNRAFPGHAHGLGFELDQRFYMGPMSSPATVGHTGFTGTSIVVDTRTESYVVLLSNRVHPRREWSSVNSARRLVAQRVANAVGLAQRDQAGRTAWHASGAGTLSVPVKLGRPGVRMAFDYFMASEDTDTLTVELSHDEGASWKPVPFVTWSRGRLSPYDEELMIGFAGSQWQHAYAELEDAGDVVLRWRYVTGNAARSRGMHLNGILIVEGENVLVDADANLAWASDHFVSDQWRLVAR